MAKTYGDLYNITTAASYSPAVPDAQAAYDADPTPANRKTLCDAINVCLAELGCTQTCA